MVRECFKTKTGIMFDPSRLRRIGLDPATLYPEVLKRPDPHPVGLMKIRRIPAGKSRTEASYIRDIKDAFKIQSNMNASDNARETEHLFEEVEDIPAPVYRDEKVAIIENSSA